MWTKGGRRERGKQMGGGGVKGCVCVCVYESLRSVSKEKVREIEIKRQRATEGDTRKWSW